MEFKNIPILELKNGLMMKVFQEIGKISFINQNLYFIQMMMY